MAPFIVVFIFLKVDNRESLKNHHNKLVLASLNVILCCSSKFTFSFILSQSGPEFKCLSTNFGWITLGCSLSNFAYGFEVELNTIVFLGCDFSQTVKSIFLDFFIRQGTCSKNFLHNEVSFLLHLEVRWSIWNTIQQSLNWEFGWFNGTFIGDIIG